MNILYHDLILKTANNQNQLLQYLNPLRNSEEDDFHENELQNDIKHNVSLCQSMQTNYDHHLNETKKFMMQIQDPSKVKSSQNLFLQAVQNNQLADKSLLAKKLLQEKCDIICFLRPPGFGLSMNKDMLIWLLQKTKIIDQIQHSYKMEQNKKLLQKLQVSKDLLFIKKDYKKYPIIYINCQQIINQIISDPETFQLQFVKIIWKKYSFLNEVPKYKQCQQKLNQINFLKKEGKKISLGKFHLQQYLSNLADSIEEYFNNQSPAILLIQGIDSLQFFDLRKHDKLVQKKAQKHRVDFERKYINKTADKIRKVIWKLITQFFKLENQPYQEYTTTLKKRMVISFSNLNNIQINKGHYNLNLKVSSLKDFEYSSQFGFQKHDIVSYLTKQQKENYNIDLDIINLKFLFGNYVSGSLDSENLQETSQYIPKFIVSKRKFLNFKDFCFRQSQSAKRDFVARMLNTFVYSFKFMQEMVKSVKQDKNYFDLKQNLNFLNQKFQNILQSQSQLIIPYVLYHMGYLTVLPNQLSTKMYIPNKYCRDVLEYQLMKLWIQKTGLKPLNEHFAIQNAETTIKRFQQVVNATQDFVFSCNESHFHSLFYTEYLFTLSKTHHVLTQPYSKNGCRADNIFFPISGQSELGIIHQYKYVEGTLFMDFDEAQKSATPDDNVWGQILFGDYLSILLCNDSKRIIQTISMRTIAVVRSWAMGILKFRLLYDEIKITRKQAQKIRRNLFCLGLLQKNFVNDENYGKERVIHYTQTKGFQQKKKSLFTETKQKSFKQAIQKLKSSSFKKRKQYQQISNSQ